jgi:5-methylcytosine-specific restriction endonuclease McrA
LHYRNLGHERPEDVVVLCPDCHRDEHVPRNLKKRELERHGQQRLFDRWWDVQRWGYEENETNEAA